MQVKKRHNNERAGRCYELAYEYLFDHDGILIHAEAFSHALGHVIGHALVEFKPTIIYEPVADRYFEKDWLYRKYAVKELARYTLKEALNQVCKSGTYGPWTDGNKNHKEEKENYGNHQH